MPVCPEYSFAGNSTYVSDSARPHRDYQHQPTPALTSAPATPLLSLKSYTNVGVPRSRYFHGGHKNAHGPLCDRYSRRSRRRHSMYAGLQLSHTSTNTNAANINHPSTATTRTNVTCIWPRTHTITPRQVIAHKCQSRLCTLFNLLTSRLDDCIGLCMSVCVIRIS